MRDFLFAATAAAVAILAPCAPALARKMRIRNLGKVHSRHACGRDPHNGGSIARCDTSTRSGTPNQGESTRGRSRPIRQCAIAYWVLRCRFFSNPHGYPPSNLPLGLSLSRRRKRLREKPSRERDYIDALAVMYVDYDKIPHQARVQSYLRSWRRWRRNIPMTTGRRSSTRSP